MPNKQKQNKRGQALMRQPRVPRNRIKANTGGETTIVRSRYQVSTLSTTAVATTYGSYYIAAGSNTGTADPAALIGYNYQEYVIRSLHIRYTPACGTTTPGQVWIGFFDNVEMINNIRLNSYGQAAIAGIAQTTKWGRGTPVWEPLDYNVPLVPRHKSFAINRESPTSLEEINRCVQGCIAWATVGTLVNTLIGSVTIEYVVELRGVQSATVTGI